MTLQELKNRCETQGFQYAYGMFEEPTEPPHLVAIIQDSDNFGADNIVYKKKNQCMMDYTYLRKDLEEQNKIENNILGDIYWEKSSENYINEEGIWQVSYFFELEEEKNNV